MSDTFFEIDLQLNQKSFELNYRLETDERYVGVFGPSGAGKTTIIECIAGWRRPKSGVIRIGDHVLFDSSKGINVVPRRRGIGYVAQDILLFPHWNVMRNVTAGAGRKAGKSNGEAAVGNEDLVQRVLESMELTDLAHRPVGHLSGGERHRVALARALCSEPDLLLLDEPLSSLDVRLKRSILGDLLRVHDEFQVPMLLISHDPIEVQVLCDFAQFIRSGKVEREGLPSLIVDVGDGSEHENILRGKVAQLTEDVAHVEIGAGLQIVVPRKGIKVGESTVLGVRADEILIADQEPSGISARNVFPARLESVERSGESVVVHARLAGTEGAADAAPLLVVNITQESCSRLRLEAGQLVHLIIKSRSIQIIASL